MPAGSPLASTALAAQLTDSRGRAYFPSEVVEVTAETCIDNPENRFAKYFVGLALELAPDLHERPEGVRAHGPAGREGGEHRPAAR